MSDLPTMTREEVIDDMVEVVCQDCKEYYYIDQEDVASDSGVCGLCEMNMLGEDAEPKDLGHDQDRSYDRHVDSLMNE